MDDVEGDATFSAVAKSAIATFMERYLILISHISESYN